MCNTRDLQSIPDASCCPWWPHCAQSGASDPLTHPHLGLHPRSAIGEPRRRTGIESVTLGRVTASSVTAVVVAFVLPSSVPAPRCFPRPGLRRGVRPARRWAAGSNVPCSQRIGSAACDRDTAGTLTATANQSVRLLQDRGTLGANCTFPVGAAILRSGKLECIQNNPVLVVSAPTGRRARITAACQRGRSWSHRSKD